jgi:cytochrome c oxidase assembly factor CtaG
MLLILMAISCLVLLAAAGVCFRREGQTLTHMRKWMFLLGAAGCGVSTGVLLLFLLFAYRAAHGETSVDLDRLFPVFWMLGLGALAAVLAIFGRRLSRLFLMGAGLLAAVTWYLAGLAVSP